MTNSQRLETVRELLRLWLADRQTATQSTDETEASIAAEAILIREGYYAGRTFELVLDTAHLRAVWFMEQDELKVRDASGSLVAAYCGEEIDSAISTFVASDSDDSKSEESGPVSIPMAAGKPLEDKDEESGSHHDDASEDDSLPQAA